MTGGYAWRMRPRHAMVSLCAVALLLVGFSGAPSQRNEICEPQEGQGGLWARDGYVQFIEEQELAPLKEALPRVDDPQIQSILESPETMWYDEHSMVFVYQDSVETVVGVRANCVGRVVGERNRGNTIGKLLELFGPDYRFRFPFRTAAGTDDVNNVRVLNFWKPPKKDGEVMPVKWWKKSRRGRWKWVFPVGTVFGEVLYEQGPQGEWYVFEIRVRERYLNGWSVDMFRPFRTASGLADAIVAERPDWQHSQNLKRFVEHLRNADALTPYTMRSEAFGKVFDPIDGALDVLPPIDDDRLIAKFLRERTFVSMEGAVWKESGELETYAPSSEDEFSIVPAGYKMGMIPVNDISCNRCHVETGRDLGHFEFDVILYGEIWGEDRIFTWHPFKPHRYIFGTWDDVDNSRTLNPMFEKADLLLNEKPSSDDSYYKPLPTPYDG